MDIKSNEDLLNHGNSVKYVFFWGHQQQKVGISKTCFSQWYESSFEVDSIVYPTAEHYMMYTKAQMFDDSEIASEIIVVKTPGEAKKLGRQVKNYNNQVWRENRFYTVVQAL